MASFGFFTILVSPAGYLIDTFRKYAASALASYNTFVRYIFAEASACSHWPRASQNRCQVRDDDFRWYRRAAAPDPMDISSFLESESVLRLSGPETGYSGLRPRTLSTAKISFIFAPFPYM